MHHNFNFQDVLSSSYRAAWQIEDVLPKDAKLDFSRNFMPEALARTAAIPFLSKEEKRVLNQIRGHEYLALFGVVEEFILPFLLDHTRPQLAADDHQVRAMLNFASEEAKHIHLFRKFHQLFADNFGTECPMIGPAEAIAAKILSHDPLAVALVILMIEWMTQNHYLDSIKDDAELDPLFKSLMLNHWKEESQHAKLDTLIVDALAQGRSEEEIDRAIDEFLEIGGFLDDGFKAQTGLNVDAFEAATGRRLSARERAALTGQQHQALRFTYIGSGMIHPKFLASLEAMSPVARERITEVAPAFG